MPTINGSVEAHVAPCTPLKTFDYFTGSEWPYILTFAAVIVFLIGKLLCYTAAVFNEVCVCLKVCAQLCISQNTMFGYLNKFYHQIAVQ